MVHHISYVRILSRRLPRYCSVALSRAPDSPSLPKFELQPRRHVSTALLRYHYQTPYVFLRYYQTNTNNTNLPPSNSDIPLPLVKAEAPQIKAEQVPTLHANNVTSKKSQKPGNKSGDGDKKHKEKKDDMQLVAVSPSLGTRIWIGTKKFVMHYYDGAKLLAIETRVSWRLLKKLLDGDKLTRREGRQLRRTVGDLFRIVPLLVFVLIPFMELLLPVALKLFPNLLPSTFESIDKKKEKKLKKLKLKLDLAKFIQETLVSTIPVKKGEPTELKRFSEFISRTRSSDPRDDIEELKSFSKLFSDNITIDNIPRIYLVAICQLLNIPSWGPDGALRYGLRSRLRELRSDDMAIRSEGLDLLTPQELQVANTDRGMRAVGVSTDRLKLQLDQWLKLRLDEQIPLTLLLLSRVMTLPSGPTPSYEDLRNALAHLPDSLIGEAKISLAAQTGEAIDNKARLDAVKAQEELIAKEQEQRQKLQKEAEDLEKAEEELAVKEQANTRVAANIQMRKETLKDLAKPILTEDEIKIRQDEVAKVLQIVSKLRDKKNPLLEEKEELRDLIEKALEHQIHLEEDDVVEEGVRQRLSKRVANTVNKSHAVLMELEESLRQDLDKVLDEDDIVLTKSEIEEAIDEILSMDKKDKLLNIVEILSSSQDGKINSTRIIEALEKIALEGTDLNTGQIKAVLKLAKRHHIEQEDDKHYLK